MVVTGTEMMVVETERKNETKGNFESPIKRNL
jgi:hypothetical protein